jgi:hypothetical protein
VTAERRLCEHVGLIFGVLSLSDFEFFIRWRAGAPGANLHRPPDLSRNNNTKRDCQPIARAQAWPEKSPIPKDGYASAMDCAKTL